MRAHLESGCATIDATCGSHAGLASPAFRETWFGGPILHKVHRLEQASDRPLDSPTAIVRLFEHGPQKTAVAAFNKRRGTGRARSRGSRTARCYCRCQ